MLWIKHCIQMHVVSIFELGECRYMMTSNCAHSPFELAKTTKACSVRHINTMYLRTFVSQFYLLPWGF